MNITKAFFTVVLLSALISGLSGCNEVQADSDNSSASDNISSAPIIGAWRINIFPTQGSQFVNLTTFNADGTSIGSDTAGNVGLGSWKQIDGNNYEAVQITLCECENMPAGSYTEIRVNAEYVNQSDSIDATFIGTVFSGDGTTLAQFDGTAKGDRINP